MLTTNQTRAAGGVKGIVFSIVTKAQKESWRVTTPNVQANTLMD